ncbi:MAG: glycosyltransferase [Candidatus Eisenbacteria bacterium]
MRLSPQRTIFPLLLVVTDLVALNAAYLTALVLRFYYLNWARWSHQFGPYYLYLIIATNVIWLVLLLYYREVFFPRRFKPTFVIPRVAKMILVTMVASVMIIFLSKGLSRHREVFHFSRPTLVAFWTLSIINICAGRFALGLLQLALFRRGRLLRPTLVVGEGEERRDLETRLAFNRWFGVGVLRKVVVRAEGPPPDEETERLPDAEALAALIRETGVREIFLAAPSTDLKQIFTVIEAARATGVAVRVIPGHLQMIVSRLLLSETLPVPDRTKEDLVFELYQWVNPRFELELATVAVIGAKGIPPTFGGIERHVAELSNRLATRGFIMKVYSRPYYTTMEGRFQGIEIQRLPTIHTKHLDAITHSALATIHTLFQRVDLAHYHAQGPSVLSFVPRFFGIRTVVTVHGLDWKRDKWGRMAQQCLRMGEAASARFPNRTITVSRTLKRYYEEKYGRTVTYIPNGIRVEEIPPAKEIIDEFGLRPRRYLLFVGRLVPEKGCHYLIRAFRSLDTDMDLAIAGGSSHSDAYLEELKEMAAGDPRIRFLDYVYGDALKELYAHCYLYVLPSDLEGLAISLLEALSFGAGVLVSDIEENLEVLTDENTPAEAWNDPALRPGPPVGFRFRHGDVEDCAGAIAGLLADPDRVDVMRGKARDWILQRYDWDVVASQTAALYRQVAKK